MWNAFSPDRRAGVLALGAGALLPFAFAPFGLAPLALIALAVLFASMPIGQVRSGFWRGYLFGLGMFGVGVSWVYVAIHDFGYTAAPIAAVMTLVFVAILALYTGLFGALAAWALGRASPRIGLLLTVPAIWLAVEWLRGWFLTGFPWLSVGYAMIDTPLGGLAPVGGVYAMGLAAAFSAALLVHLWRERRDALITAVPVLAVIWGGGALLGKIQWTQPDARALNVTLVQGNQPQLTKWDPEGIRRGLEVYAGLSREHFGKSDLVVWPENAATVFYQDLRKHYFDPLAEEARAAGTDLILGVPTLDEDGERYYTTLMSLGSSHGFYAKSHLVPFGEFVPLESLLRGLINFFDLPMSSFTPGPAGQSPLSAAGVRIAASVCYEDAFGEEIRRGLQDAVMLVNGSNNAWYGDSLAPHQHLQISRLRALETGRPLLRATTNGISALVDHRGQVIARSPQFQTYVVNGQMQPMRGTTPYVRWGDAPVLVLVGVGLSWAAWRRRRREAVVTPPG